MADVERIDHTSPSRLETSRQNFTLGNGRSPLRQARLLAAFVIASNHLGTWPRSVRSSALPKTSLQMARCRTSKAGTLLKVGDSIRTRSSSTWVKLALNDGSVMTIAGRSGCG
ncbi:MAG: hypothetical protein CM1200mP29_11290 [Verrucomicrobiota bacterium]|nr:MAG: hypothetical protein CM1200mP29_11290 [Verrucomicrobiota bacterium]